MTNQEEYPVTNYVIAVDGILCETVFSPTISHRTVIPESKVIEIFKAWVTSRKKSHAEQAKQTAAMHEDIESLIKEF